MSELKAKKVWRNGQFVDWEKASVHVLSHALHYGSSWFEGIRCYETSRGPEVFRLPEHIERLYSSCKIYRTQIPFTQEEFISAALETVKVNDLRQCYVRPLVLRGLGAIVVNPLKASTEVFIMAWEWGRYLGEDALEKGVDVCVSSWTRAAPNTFPSIAKAGGNYLNSSLMKMEAELRGYAEAIALDSTGLVSEGSGENLFMVKDGVLITPPMSHAILPGITRNTVVTLWKDMGKEVQQSSIPREMLYLADELFFTGTAAEVVPIRTVDDIVIGSGQRGPVTEKIQRAFFEIIQGDVDDRHGWLTPVFSESPVSHGGSGDGGH